MPYSNPSSPFAEQVPPPPQLPPLATFPNALLEALRGVMPAYGASAQGPHNIFQEVGDVGTNPGVLLNQGAVVPGPMWAAKVEAPDPFAPPINAVPSPSRASLLNQLLGGR